MCKLSLVASLIACYATFAALGARPPKPAPPISSSPSPTPAATSAPGPAPATPAASPPPPSRPPLWQIHYDDAMRAFNNRKWSEAIGHFEKAVNALSKTDEPNKKQLYVDIGLKVGKCHLNIAESTRDSSARKNALSKAHYQLLSVRESLEPTEHDTADLYAMVTEQLADIDVLWAGECASLRDCLGPIKSSQYSPTPTTLALYLEALQIRERELGPDHRDVMLYRRKVIRRANGFLRSINAGMKSASKEEVYEAEPLLGDLRNTIKSLRERDAELSRDDPNATTNGGP